MNVLAINEIDAVAAGVTWGQVGVGLAMLSLGVAVVMSGGLAAMPIGIIAGAGFSADLAIAGTGLLLSGGGGGVIGAGLRN